MSKGDNRRPSSVSKEEYDGNFEAAFGRKEIQNWKDAPGSERGDQSGGGSSDGDQVGRQELQGQDGHSDPKAPYPVEGETCPRCGTTDPGEECWHCGRLGGES